MNSKQKYKSRIVLLGIAGVACILAISLYWTQVMNGQSYSARADQQYVRPSTSVFDRGSIYFQAKDNTRVVAATMGSGFIVYMNPKLVNDAAQTYDALSHFLSIDRQKFMEKANKEDDSYEELTHRISTEDSQSILGLGLKGIGVAKETWRSYPGNFLAAHELGLIGQNASSTSIEGKYGLERSYNETLSRQNIGGTSKSYSHIFSDIRTSVFGSTENTGSIITTIEPTVQSYLEKILADTLAVWHADEIGGIVLDPQTGEIVAMASLPSYDPNSLSDIKNPSVFSNPLVEHVYEMGSIMKPLTMAVALDTGAETPQSTYDDKGTLTLTGKKISNYDGVARGVIPMQEILSQSLNVGAATIALKVGKENFQKYFLSFGFGEKTGIDEPNEAKGIVGNLKSGRDIEIATAAYGQGIAISPIAMTRALAVLGNGGYAITPHTVRSIEYVDGTKKNINIDKGDSLLRRETVDDVTRMLVKVVDKKMAIAHPDLRMENYSIAAKTGTAQIPDHLHGGYYSDRYLHSFFGYFPAYDAKYVVFLYQIHPKGAQYASETLTEPFSQLAKFLINYYNIAPDR